METKEERIKRFDGSPREVISTLLNGINNHINQEIRNAKKMDLFYLVMLGIHAVALTISEVFYCEKSHEKSYKRFLEDFLDGEEENDKFSLISVKLHDLRNKIAHQWLSKKSYDLIIDSRIKNSWEEKDEIIYFNDNIYFEAFNKAFSMDGKIWEYYINLTEENLELISKRIIEKYQKK